MIKRKKIIKKYICRIFETSYITGTKLLELSNSNIVTFFIIASFVLTLVTVKFNLTISLFFFLLNYLGLFVSLCNDILLSLSGFLLIGMLYWCGITILVLYSIWNTIGGGAIIIYPVIFVSWCFYSLLANNKVATVANQIYSTILALLAIMKDTIIYSIPETFLEKVDASGNTHGRIIEISIGKILYPVLAINLVALLLCSLKGYWITKYNDGRDLEYSEDMNQDDTDMEDK